MRLRCWPVPVLLLLGSAVVAEGPPAPAGPGPPLRLIDAVRATLEHQPEIQLAQQQVALARGAAQVARGQFDVHLEASLGQRGDSVALTQAEQAANGGAASATTYTTSYQLGLRKQFRFGMTVRPSLQLSRTARSLADPAVGQARVAFTVVQPLLRGRGAEATGAREAAAHLDEQASLLWLRHAVAQRIQETAAAYWSYRAAHEAIRVWREAEERAALLLQEQARLVRARERPAAELQTLEASRADFRAFRLAAERQAIEARQALGLAMGLPWRDIQALQPPVDDFATVGDEAELAQANLEALVARALEQRSDHLAARVALRAAGVLLRGARRDAEPQLDLSLELGYAGLSEGNGVGPFFTPLGERVTGPNFFGALTFAYPVENSVARGLIQQREAGQRRSAIQLADLARRIGVDVALALGTLRTATAELAAAEEALRAYAKAVANEKKRLRGGLSTIFDVIQIESRLTSADLRALQARARVASAVVQFRFSSGTLIEAAGRMGVVGMEQLTTLPPLR